MDQTATTVLPNRISSRLICPVVIASTTAADATVRPQKAIPAKPRCAVRPFAHQNPLHKHPSPARELGEYFEHFFRARVGHFYCVRRSQHRYTLGRHLHVPFFSAYSDPNVTQLGDNVCQIPVSASFDGGPGRSPTCDLRVRSALLYATELPGH
jgi:hypothetical protein